MGRYRFLDVTDLNIYYVGGVIGVVKHILAGELIVVASDFIRADAISGWPFGGLHLGAINCHWFGWLFLDGRYTLAHIKQIIVKK